jgi:CRISPR-associated endoribonuclease Cas6
MRLHVTLSSDEKPVPFNHQPQITGAIHKWLGINDVHDAVSLYSFSWLQGGKKVGDHLKFTDGSRFYLSAYDTDLIKAAIRGIQLDPSISFGLSVSELSLEETPEFSDKAIFRVSSPVLVKRKVDNREVHYTFEDLHADHLLTETLKTKLRKAGMNDDGVGVRFQRDFPGARSKISYYNKIGNRVNICPVEIEGSPEQIAFAWNVGVGNSTGIGYGSIK